MITSISRRKLLLAGLSTSIIAFVPRAGWTVDIPLEELEPIGPGAVDSLPYKGEETGQVSADIVASLSYFTALCIKAWQFPGMELYPDQISGILQAKSAQPPSYLAEYYSAGQIITDVKSRLGSDEKTFVYLLFAERGESVGTGTRLGRARKFVFDELTRHIVANGGFRRFGLTNYEGFISTSFYDPRAYRRARP